VFLNLNNLNVDLGALLQNAVLRSRVVCPSVCLSETLVNCDHIGWNSSKIISRLVRLGCSRIYSPCSLCFYYCMQSKSSTVLSTFFGVIGLLICFINTRFTALMNFCVGIYFQNIQHLAVVVYVACYQRWPQANNDVTVKTLYWGHECDLSRSRDVIGHVTTR